MSKTHYFPPDQVHFTWDTTHEPVITIDSGDTVIAHTRDVSDGQIDPTPPPPTSRPRLGSRISARRADRRERREARRHARDRGAGPPHAGLGLDGHPARRPGPVAGRFPGRLPAHLRPQPGRRDLVPRRHRDPARALPRHDGRLPRRRQQGGRDAARQLRRQHGYPPARPRLHALPAGAGGRCAVQLRRRSWRTGRRRGLRDRHRVADVRLAALHTPEGTLDPARRSTAPRGR